MRVRHRLIALVFGVRHLLGAGLWTPPRYRAALRAWPQDASIPDDELRDLLRSWSAQQTVAWTLAHLIAWAGLIYAGWWWK